MRADRVLAGMKAATAHGRWPFRAALGYLNGRDATGAAVLIPDPDRADLVRQAFRMAAEGASIQAITTRCRLWGCEPAREIGSEHRAGPSCCGSRSTGAPWKWPDGLLQGLRLIRWYLR